MRTILRVAAFCALFLAVVTVRAVRAGDSTFAAQGNVWFSSSGAVVPGTINTPHPGLVTLDGSGTTPALVAYGVDRGNGTRYETVIGPVGGSSGDPGVLTNGNLTVNGASGDPVPYCGGNAQNGYMICSASDIGNNPNVWLDNCGGQGDAIRYYDGGLCYTQQIPTNMRWRVNYLGDTYVNSVQMGVPAPTPTVDTGISRDAAGVVDVGNGTLGDKSGKINASTFTGSTVRVIPGLLSALPSCTTNLAGTIAFQSDATACVTGASPQGGGTTFCELICNGTGWVQQVP